jgi:hypothetical protein
VTTTVSRTFSLAQSADATGQTGVSKPFSAFFNESALVVLGEPGAGKTTAFTAAASEEGAVFVLVRDFLALSPSRWVGETLYLDGLDELRGKTRDGASVLDALRARLDGLGRPRFRLSCRAADWYGVSDVARLQFVAPDDKVTVLRIDPLTDADILAIAGALTRDPRAFVVEAITHGVEELLRNPLTLEMLLRVVEEGAWPATRGGLYARAIKVLGRDQNPEHSRVQRAMVSFDEVLRAAQVICAAVLCGGAKGIALTEGAVSSDHPSMGDLAASRDALAIAARSRLFTSDGDERVVPLHRTVAEYLAAGDLAARVREGLPLERVLAVLTGYDGRPVTDLRGVFAWLACLVVDHRTTLIERDPLGVVLYGDATGLTTSDRVFLLGRLRRLATQDPWFRANSWNAPAVGGLATPDMAETFRSILEDRAAPLGLTVSVLEAIRYGRSLPQLKEALLEILKDGDRDDLVRVDAVRALIHVAPDDVALLLGILEDVHQGTINDDERRLRGILLRSLYLRAVAPDQVARFLVAPSRRFIGEYTMFVEHELLSATPSDALSSLLDGVAKRPALRRREDFARFLGRLLLRGLTEQGEIVEAPRLWAWLGIGLGEHDESKLDNDDQAAVRQWLAVRPARFRDLYSHWLVSTASADLWRQQWLFWRRAGFAEPEGHGSWLLERAAEEGDEVRAEFLFRQGARWLMTKGDPQASIVDEMFAFAEKHVRFVGALREELCVVIPEWQVEDAQRRQDYRRRDAERLRLNKERLSSMVAGISQGSAVGALSHLAQVFFGLFSDLDRDKGPAERLADIASPEYAPLILKGFVAVLQRRDLPTPEMIGQLQMRSRSYGVGYAVLAGCDLLAAESMDAFCALPTATLKTAVAFHQANMTGSSHPWVEWLKGERPDLVGEALSEFWVPHLTRNAGDVPGLHELLESGGAEVGRRLALALLTRFSASREGTLRLLLGAAMKYGDRVALAALCERVLGTTRIRGSRRLLWLATAFALESAQLGVKVVAALRGKREQARTFVGFLCSKERGAGDRLGELGIPERALLIRLLGPMFPPRELTEGWQRVESDWEMAQVVRGLIERTSGDGTAAAGQALRDLLREPALSAWRDFVAHAVGVQQANQREVEFRYPSIEAVIETLRGGPPANEADLQALLASELRDLAEEIRNGATDGWKALWNVDRHDRPTDPRPEDDCRDRLLERLRPRLVRNQVALEPEGRYAEEKRADIKAVGGALNIPVEIKRHYHRDLWSAPEDQLSRLYARDPGSGGRGIFLALWFGADVKLPPKAPPGVIQPSSAAELLQSLTGLIPPDDRAVTEIVVIDCSRASSSTRSGRRRAAPSL